MGYDSTARRRARVLSRLVRSTVDPRSYPAVGVVPAYWWDGHANFGDALTPWLLRPRGVLPFLVAPDRARMVGVGSILEHVPEDFTGAVWGTGLIRDEPRRLPHARFLAVRGALTRDRLGLDDTVPLGDPGLLAPDVVPRDEVRYDLGLVPHSDHHASPEVRALRAVGDPRVHYVDVRRGPAHVVREISRCRAVVSTSLHGLVVADAYGIPAAWARLAPDLIGGTFKFRDHESVVTPGRTRRIDLTPRDTVESLLARTSLADAERVRAAIDGLRASVAGLPVTRDLPFLAWRHR